MTASVKWSFERALTFQSRKQKSGIEHLNNENACKYSSYRNKFVIFISHKRESKIASTSCAIVSIENENTGMMGPETPTSAPSDEYVVQAFVKSVIEAVMCIPDAVERDEARGKID